MKKQTKGNIGTAISELPWKTALVPVSAVFLNEKWAMPFGSNDTQQEDFHLKGGRTVKVPMMQRHTTLCRYAEAPGWQAVALFYHKDGRPGRAAALSASCRGVTPATLLARSLPPNGGKSA